MHMCGNISFYIWRRVVCHVLFLQGELINIMMQPAVHNQILEVTQQETTKNDTWLWIKILNPL